MENPLRAGVAWSTIARITGGCGSRRGAYLPPHCRFGHYTIRCDVNGALTKEQKLAEWMLRHQELAAYRAKAHHTVPVKEELDG